MALGQREGAQLVEGGLDTFFMQDGHIFIFAPYSSVLLSVRDNLFIMPNGFVLVKRLQERPESNLIVPDYLKNKPHKFLVEVIASGAANSAYLDRKYYDVQEPLHPGRQLIVREIGLIKLENDMHATLPKDWYVIQRRWIMGITSAYISPEKLGVQAVEQ